MNQINRVALIDGDVIAYKSSVAVQKDIDWGDGLWTCHAFLGEATVQAEAMIEGLTEDFDKIILTFSDKHNFRKDILPTYKSNRIGKRKPTCYKGLVAWLKDHYKSYTYKNLEGDDVLGILATEPVENNERVILSIDKDFKTIPSKFYDFSRDEFYDHTKNDALYWHMYQTLIGDVTDGYSGCPTYGPVKAKRLLNSVSPEEYWDAVVDAYKTQGLTEEDALLQARVAHILHYGDYNMETGEVKLWTPN